MCTRLVTKLVITLCVFLVYTTRSVAQLTYSFERINTENGLTTNALKGIVFDDANRFLWVATESGLLRYNGHGFQTFGDAKGKSKLNSRIINIVKKADHTIFGTLEDYTLFTINKNMVDYESTKKSVRWAGEIFDYIYETDYYGKKKNTNSINFPLLKVRDNYFEIEDNKLLCFSKDSVYLLKQNYSNRYVFSFNNQIFVINNFGDIQELKYALKDTFQFKFNSVKAINPPFISVANSKKQFKLFQDLSNDNVYVLLDNNIYEITFEAGSLKFNLLIPSIPGSDYIRYFQFDKITKTAYLATDNRGLIIAHPQYFVRKQPFKLNSEISTSVYAQVQLPNGDIQVNNGAFFGNQVSNNFQYFDIISEPRTFTTKDSSFFYTNYLGVTKLDLKTKQRKIVSSDVFFNKSAFLEIDGLVYLFSNFGVGVLDKKDQLTKLAIFPPLSINFTINDVAFYTSNLVLLATSDGLFIYDLKLKTLKLIYKDPTGSHFRTIYRYNDYFIFGTYGGGIYIFSNNVIKPVVLDKNNYLKFAHCFIPNGNDVWISTNKGIFKSTFQSFVSNFKNQNIHPNYKYFGKQEGIDILEMNGGCTPCAIKLLNGDISVPGIDGLIQFNPNLLPRIKIKPKVYIDKYKLDNEFVEEDQFTKTEIPHQVNVVQLILGISGMLSEENIEVEYKQLENKSWRTISVNNSIISIENSQPGNHLLNIRWRNTDSQGWEYITVTYSIAYPWYAHPFMYFGYLVIIVLLILLYVKIKTIIYARRQNELETEVTSKTKNLQDINTYLIERNQAKDQVIAIMNHDILTPLKYLHITAANLENNLKGTDAAKPIGQIKATTKELEYLTSNLLSWVKFDTINQLDNKQPIDVKLLIDSIIDFILPFKQSDKVGIVNNVPDGTVIYGWHDPMRVLVYNLLMNSIKSTSKGNIVISSNFESNKFILSVADDGSGMNQAMVNFLLTGVKSKEQFISPKYKKGNGVGYQIIRNLVKLIFAEMQISSKINEGTIVKIIIKQL